MSLACAYRLIRSIRWCPCELQAACSHEFQGGRRNTIQQRSSEGGDYERIRCQSYLVC